MDLQYRVDELFNFFDTNDDGVISRGEFASVVEILIGNRDRRQTTIFQW